MTPELRSIPLASLTLSQSPAQAERRKRFDKAKLGELTDSVKEHGVVQPIVVRPRFKEDHGQLNQWEVVAGERRYLAAKAAGLPDLLATVRDLSDEQAQEIQLIENLQRADLHELAQAEGYEGLLKLGHSVEEIAAKVGTSTATVYARMKLLDLCENARKAFYANKISASIALLLARIPVDEHQDKALEHILKPHSWNDEAMSYRDAVRYIHDEFTLRLTEAPFPIDDPDLVPGAGTCAACPKRTGNQPELFGDIKRADVCTDLVCFRGKRSAWNKIQVAKAKETGATLITGAEAKKVQSKWSSHLGGGYVRPTDKVPEDPKGRTYAKLLAKTDAPTVLLQNPDTGKFSRVYQRSAVAADLAKKGVTLRKDPAPESASASKARQEAEEAKKKQEMQYRGALFRAVLSKASSKIGRDELEAIAVQLWGDGYGDDAERYEILGWSVTEKMTYNNRGGVFERQLKKLNDAELTRVINVLPLLREATETWDKPRELLEAAKRLKIDPEKIRRELAAEKASKPVAAKKKRKAA